MTGSIARTASNVREYLRIGTYRAGVAVVVLSSLLTVWTTIVRDDGQGIGFFLLILAVPVGGFAALFEPAGMARTLLGVAAMQVVFGVANATAPIIASQPDGSFKALVFSGFYTALWLAAGAFFRAAAKKK